MLANGNELIGNYKSEIDQLKADVMKMEATLMNIVKDDHKEDDPKLVANMKGIFTDINMQRNENEQLQKELALLQKEKALTQQAISELGTKIDCIEKDYKV